MVRKEGPEIEFYDGFKLADSFQKFVTAGDLGGTKERLVLYGQAEDGAIENECVQVIGDYIGLYTRLTDDKAELANLGQTNPNEEKCFETIAEGFRNQSANNEFAGNYD